MTNMTLASCSGVAVGGVISAYAGNLTAQGLEGHSEVVVLSPQATATSLCPPSPVLLPLHVTLRGTVRRRPACYPPTKLLVAPVFLARHSCTHLLCCSRALPCLA